MGDDHIAISRVVDEFSPPVICGDERCRDMFMELIYCVAIPGAVVIVLALFLSYYMCCGRSHRKIPSDADQIQMEKYNSIRRASQSLRDLSRKRDTLLVQSRSGSLSITADSERLRPTSRSVQDSSYSASNTLQRDRHHLRQENTQGGARPPSYQLPPEYSSLSYVETEPSRPHTLTVPAQHHRNMETQALIADAQ